MLIELQRSRQNIVEMENEKKTCLATIFGKKKKKNT